MSVIVLDEIEFYEIGKSLNLKFDFLNRLYHANQKAYDITYNLDQPIESLNKIEYENNDRVLDQTRLNHKLRSIRYNTYPNDQDSLLNEYDLKKIDLLVHMTNVKEIEN